MEITSYQKKCLDILIEFDIFCEENKLTYFLSSGTLLGAVRHSGFIPWDDDIDVSMPRLDYERLIEMRSLFNADFKIESFKTNARLAFPYLKIFNENTTVIANDTGFPFKCGAWVDVFPLDGTFDNKFLRLTQMKALIVLRNLFSCKVLPIKVLSQRSFFTRLFYNVLPIGLIYYLLHGLSQVCDYSASKYAGCLSCYYGEKETMPRSYFGKGSKKTGFSFHGYFFNTPDEPKRYLRNMYGDFMALPPLEKRVNHNVLLDNIDAPYEKLGYIEEQ